MQTESKLPLIFWVSLCVDVLFILSAYFYWELFAILADPEVLYLCLFILFVFSFLYSIYYVFKKDRSTKISPLIPLLMNFFTIIILVGSLYFDPYRREVDKKECYSKHEGYSIEKDHVIYISGYHWDDGCGPIGCGPPSCLIMGHELPNVDLETFEIIDKSHAKDKNNVYDWYQIVDDADPDTFEIIDSAYSKDKNQVYFGDRTIEGLDPDTFEIIHGAYAKDTNFVSFQDHIIEGADLETFEIIEGAYSRDINNVYLSGKVVEGVEPETFMP